MKRLVLFFPLLLVAVMSYGQEVAQEEPSQSCIVRKGDRYTVDGVTYINSTEFRGYLKNTNPEVFTQYDKGYRIGMAGWGLFAYGVAMMPISFMFSIVQDNGPEIDPMTGERRYDPKLKAAWSNGWWSSFIIATAALGAGITLLGVGYYKMHQSVDVYNVSRQPQPQAFWSIKASGNGIGVAYNF